MKHHPPTDPQTLPLGTANALPLARASKPGLYHRFGKRGCDLVLALMLVPVTMCIVAAIFVITKVAREKGSLFFGHLRIGRNGKVFKCWKIRTMVPDADRKLRAHLAQNPKAAAEWATRHKLTDDPRITPLGRFLRKTSLDELPQLWNVLRGDMSLVGPRPIVRTELYRYGAQGALYTSVRPGVTGLWQVSGRNGVSYDERVRLDVAYVRNISLLSDIRLVLKTILVMLARTGK